ncbi:MAG TPA: hypothetical protein VF185_02895 [Patescibacteria group bacterium]
MKDKNGKRLTLGETIKKIINRFYNYFLDFELMILRWSGNIPFHTIRKFIYRLAGVKLAKGQQYTCGQIFLTQQMLR